jgi:hypothetical protein
VIQEFGATSGVFYFFWVCNLLVSAAFWCANWINRPKFGGGPLRGKTRKEKYGGNQWSFLQDSSSDPSILYQASEMLVRLYTSHEMQKHSFGQSLTYRTLECIIRKDFRDCRC